MLFSILIPTLVERHARFAQLYSRLQTQIHATRLAADVEICVLEDNREQLLGSKRNILLDGARGDYSAFVDDDDAVASDYVAVIANALRATRQ